MNHKPSGMKEESRRSTRLVESQEQRREKEVECRTLKLRDLGQLPELLSVSVSSSVKWG